MVKIVLSGCYVSKNFFTKRKHSSGSSTMPMCAKLTADTPIYAKYAETGTASSTGGPWFVKIEYVVPGSGETIQM